MKNLLEGLKTIRQKTKPIDNFFVLARLTKGAENVRRAKRRARRARLTTALVRGQFRAANLTPSVAPSERHRAAVERTRATSKQVVDLFEAQPLLVGVEPNPVYRLGSAPTLWIDEWGSAKCWFKPGFRRKTYMSETLRGNPVFSALKPRARCPQA